MCVEQISSGGTTTYLHHDQQGSTRLLTGSAGTVTGKCTYTPYGTPTCEGTTNTPLGYDGQYTSSDTGLIYLRARTYDPATGQFLSVDPDVAETQEPYGYAGDNPVNGGDPTGMCAATAYAAAFKKTWSPEQCDKVYRQIKGLFHELETRLLQLQENKRNYGITKLRKYVKTFEDKQKALQDSLKQYNLHGCPDEIGELIPETVYELSEAEG